MAGNGEILTGDKIDRDHSESDQGVSNCLKCFICSEDVRNKNYLKIPFPKEGAIILCHILEIPPLENLARFVQFNYCHHCRRILREIHSSLDLLVRLEKTVLDRKEELRDLVEETCSERRQHPWPENVEDSSVREFRDQIMMGLTSKSLFSSLSKVSDHRFGKEFYGASSYTIPVQTELCTPGEVPDPEADFHVRVRVVDCAIQTEFDILDQGPPPELHRGVDRSIQTEFDPTDHVVDLVLIHHVDCSIQTEFYPSDHLENGVDCSIQTEFYPSDHLVPGVDRSVQTDFDIWGRGPESDPLVRSEVNSVRTEFEPCRGAEYAHDEDHSIQTGVDPWGGTPELDHSQRQQIPEEDSETTATTNEIPETVETLDGQQKPEEINELSATTNGITEMDESSDGQQKPEEINELPATTNKITDMDESCDGQQKPEGTNESQTRKEITEMDESSDGQQKPEEVNELSATTKEITEMDESSVGQQTPEKIIESTATTNEMIETDETSDGQQEPEEDSETTTDESTETDETSVEQQKPEKLNEIATTTDESTDTDETSVEQQKPERINEIATKTNEGAETDERSDGQQKPEEITEITTEITETGETAEISDKQQKPKIETESDPAASDVKSNDLDPGVPPLKKSKLNVELHNSSDKQQEPEASNETTVATTTEITVADETSDGQQKPEKINKVTAKAYNGLGKHLNGPFSQIRKEADPAAPNVKSKGLDPAVPPLKSKQNLELNKSSDKQQEPEETSETTTKNNETDDYSTRLQKLLAKYYPKKYLPPPKPSTSTSNPAVSMNEIPEDREPQKQAVEKGPKMKTTEKDEPPKPFGPPVKNKRGSDTFNIVGSDSKQNRAPTPCTSTSNPAISMNVIPEDTEPQKQAVKKVRKMKITTEKEEPPKLLGPSVTPTPYTSTSNHAISMNEIPEDTEPLEQAVKKGRKMKITTEKDEPPKPLRRPTNNKRGSDNFSIVRPEFNQDHTPTPCRPTSNPAISMNEIPEDTEPQRQSVKKRPKMEIITEKDEPKKPRGRPANNKRGSNTFNIVLPDSNQNSVTMNLDKKLNIFRTEQPKAKAKLLLNEEEEQTRKLMAGDEQPSLEEEPGLGDTKVTKKSRNKSEKKIPAVKPSLEEKPGVSDTKATKNSKNKTSEKKIPAVKPSLEEMPGLCDTKVTKKSRNKSEKKIPAVKPSLEEKPGVSDTKDTKNSKNKTSEKKIPAVKPSLEEMPGLFDTKATKKSRNKSEKKIPAVKPSLEEKPGVSDTKDTKNSKNKKSEKKIPVVEPKKSEKRRWMKEKTFLTAEDAEEAVQLGGFWMLDRVNKNNTGQKAYYSCGWTANGEHQCDAGLYLLYDSASPKVALFRCLTFHGTHVKDRYKGISDANKEQIKQIYMEGVTAPEEIVKRLQKLRINDVTTPQISHYLQDYI